MAATAPFIICFVLGLLCLSVSGLQALSWLPSWLQAPLLQIGSPATNGGQGRDFSDPTALLLQRLEKVDVAREPQTAHSLHTAIGKILRASGTQNKQAVLHFEAARDAAALGTDQDTLIAAYLDLAEAYVEDGRPLDSQKALLGANRVLPDHYVEHRSKLHRGQGRAKFELGFPASALQWFKAAEEAAVQAEDKVRVACDIARVHTCAGKASESVQTLKQALEVLQAVRKVGSDGGMPAAVHTALAADVHFRLAEAYHSMKNSAFAMAHYKTALNLQQKSLIPKDQRIPAINRGITYLDSGIAPELICPSLPTLPWNEVPDPSQSTGDATFITKINLLLAEHRYDKVESELKASLRAHSRPYKSPEAAVALNMLGNLYRNQKSFSKAGKHFRQALHAAKMCCGPHHQEAQTAYQGLRDVKAELPFDEQRVASAAINIFEEALEKAGVSVKKPVEDGETSKVQTRSEEAIVGV